MAALWSEYPESSHIHAAPAHEIKMGPLQNEALLIVAILMGPPRGYLSHDNVLLYGQCGREFRTSQPHKAFQRPETANKYSEGAETTEQNP